MSHTNPPPVEPFAESELFARLVRAACLIREAKSELNYATAELTELLHSAKFGTEKAQVLQLVPKAIGEGAL